MQSIKTIGNKGPSVSGPVCDRFPQKFDVQTSCKYCEHHISLGNLSHDSAFDRGTQLFKYKMKILLIRFRY